MNVAQNHIIEKVFLEINIGSVSRGNEIKNNISQFLKIELFPRLENLLNLYDAKNEILRFERLDINFKVNNWGNLEDVKTEFEKELVKKIKGEISVAKKRATSKTKQNSGALLSIEDSREMTFLFFIENGFQPWFGKENYLSEITSKENWIKCIENPDFVSKFTGILNQGNTDSLNRFIFQFSQRTVIRFIKKLNARVEKTDTELTGILKILPQTGNDLFMKFLLEVSLNKEVEVWSATLKKLFLSFAEDTKSVVFQPNRMFFVELKELLINVVSELHHNILNQLFTNIEKIKIPVELSLRKSTEEIENGYENHSHIMKEKLIKSSFSNKNQKEFFFEKDDSELVVNNAGLILLHPFLKHFFLELKILNENGNFNSNKENIAVQALHYLASCNENVFESSLVFEKFLCNIPLKKTIIKKSLLSDKIKGEAENLLKAAIRNWPELKNTSPNGMRELFLQREGKLVFNKGRYKVIVERKPQDLLLDRLKWNISVIKLPWKKDLILIEW